MKDGSLSNVEKEIKIHTPGTRVTDKELARIMTYNRPYSFGAAKKVLAKTDKYLNERGWFTNQRKRFEKLREALTKLDSALEREDYKNRLRPRFGTGWVLLDYFDQISDVYPNWQPEYIALNHIIPDLYPPPAKSKGKTKKERMLDLRLKLEQLRNKNK